MNIAIDGPAGAGKSTVAQQVAKRLAYLYIDTGSMYRALAWAVLNNRIPIDDEAAVSELLRSSDIRLERERDSQRVFWNGQDITDQIRTPEVSQYASIVASYPSVREQMLVLQRQMAAGGNVVMDGRDIGTHVLPDADVKIFLTASTRERAERRLKELLAKGLQTDLATLEAEIAERDKRDMEREAAPLRQAADAVLVDTTGMTIEQVVEQILKICERSGESIQ
ncbi:MULTISPECIES: (d)CMP kinase [Bacillales]|jgi:cytidylate kinase|uniref:(d)CMP kinase n=1 Tax=Brevibacillus TaxID=55080 RepID=UPI000E3B2BD5|nr:MULTISPECIES: (d)CMP kinase [Bacillales]REK62253.1 MAG: (d)CMP kinase [Brevibacillus sp.]MBR8658583.1 (d)CMP kinase [Brevibacillus sp. NL20B1]MDT3415347.1 cytidylate kinase [Brevibacillus aydinogluensis]NNV02175.1 (d)CMP kinase [Brevibacillus sp. MCWH]UFJ60434.1 (d)CMP kinase [Anoxybacillus sediminis]